MTTTTSEPVRVLLADDHAIVRKGIREFLEEDHVIAVVAEASGGAEAVRLAGEYRPTVTPAAAQEQVEPLTERELDVLRPAAQGLTNKSIAAELGLLHLLPQLNGAFVPLPTTAPNG